jgi:hypothetical protein
MPCGSNDPTFEFRPGLDAIFEAIGLSTVVVVGVVVSVVALVVVPVLVADVVVVAFVVLVVGAGDFFAWP